MTDVGTRRRILPCWNPMLRVICRPVAATAGGLEDLVRDMHVLMGSQRGIGLAAPQVGDDRRVVLVRRPDDPPGRTVVMLNPELLECSDEIVPFEEGCLSFPGIYRFVLRPRRVRVRYHDLSGEPQELEVGGILARVVQHEIDHLDGILFIDHLGFWGRRDVLWRMALRRLGLVFRGGTM